MCARVRLISTSAAETLRLLNIEQKLHTHPASIDQTASKMEKEAVAALHKTMRVLREELEEREATIRRLRRRRRNVTKKRNSLCLFTFEEAASEQHQRYESSTFSCQLHLLIY